MKWEANKRTRTPRPPPPLGLRENHALIDPRRTVRAIPKGPS